MYLGRCLQTSESVAKYKLNKLTVNLCNVSAMCMACVLSDFMKIKSMADNPNKKAADAKRISQQPHEQAYQKRKRKEQDEGGRSSSGDGRSSSRGGRKSSADRGK